MQVDDLDSDVSLDEFDAYRSQMNLLSLMSINLKSCQLMMGQTRHTITLACTFEVLTETGAIHQILAIICRGENPMCAQVRASQKPDMSVCRYREHGPQGTLTCA